MTLKLHSLDRWSPLIEGEAIVFDKSSGTGSRRVRLHLNMARQTTFFVETADGERLLTTAGPGLETIEFSASGKIAVFAEAGAAEVHYQTSEYEPTHVRVVDPVIFTKIANRRHRNPELEEIMFRMNQNMERRLQQQSAEFEAALERRRKEETDGRPPEIIETDAPGAAANDPAAVQPQEPPSPSPVEDAGGEAGGEQSGD